MTKSEIELDTSIIEKKLIEEQENDVKDPVEGAAMMYGLYAPKFLQGVKKLSSRGRTRVMKALIEYPLNQKAYNHSSLFEKQMMDIGHAVLEAKFLMIMATMYNNIDSLMDAADPNIPADLSEEEEEKLKTFMTEDSINKGLKAAKE